MDQREFLRQMEDLLDYGRSRENQLTKKEITEYCSDLDLTKEQLELVYAYLKEHQIHVPGFQSTEFEKQEQAAKEQTEDSRYLRLYRKELRSLQERSPEELEELYKQLRMGEETAIASVIESHLKRVLSMASKYRGRGVLLEDLIQEGNLELTTCVSMLCGNQEVVDYKKAIEHAVRSRLIELLDEELSNSDSVSAVLGRVNLLMEATRCLAEEYGRIATMEELSEFTHMDTEEIQMYVELSRNAIEIGNGESGDKKI